MISSSGVSPFIGSEVLIANSAGAVDNNNIVSFSGSWGTLKLPDSDSVVRDNQFSASTRSSLREEDVITGAVALNGDIIVAPENYIGNPNATLATGNTYAPGYCTWYAYNRRIEMGLPALTSWGHAYQWVSGAGASGYKVDHNPQIGDIISIDGGWLGHVAIVEELGPNNTVRISEMNYGYVYNYNERWIINATQYSYIH
jgi:surface antigen